MEKPPRCVECVVCMRDMESALKEGCASLGSSSVSHSLTSGIKFAKLAIALCRLPSGPLEIGMSCRTANGLKTGLKVRNTYRNVYPTLSRNYLILHIGNTFSTNRSQQPGLVFDPDPLCKSLCNFCKILSASPKESALVACPMTVSVVSRFGVPLKHS